METNFFNEKIKELTEKVFAKNYQTKQIIRSKYFVDHHFASAVDLQDISSSAYYSKFHFARLFKKHYGVTPIQYLTGNRIAEAKRLLWSGESVTATCYAVGFNSLTSFIVLFRKATGKLPSQFKKARFKK